MTEIQKRLEELGAKPIVNAKPDGSQEIVVGVDLCSSDIPEKLDGVGVFINTRPIITSARKNEPVYLWRAFPLTKVDGKFRKLSTDELPVPDDFEAYCEVGGIKHAFMASPVPVSPFPHIVGS